MTCQQARPMLDALFDGELEPGDQLSVQSHVRECATCARMLEAMRAVRSAVRSAGAERSTAPTELTHRLRTAGREGIREESHVTPPRPWRRTLFALAATVLLALGLAGGVLVAPQLHRGNSPVTGANEIIAAHVRSLMASHLLDVASTDQHTVKPWFEGKLDFAPPVKDLAAKGFPLIGGRLDYLGGRPAAALVYRRNQHTINLFISQDAPDAMPRSAQSQGYSIISWREGGLSFCAVSTLNRNDLASFADGFRESPATQPE